MQKIVLATNNQGKITELKALLNPIECISQSSLLISPIAETGLTFIENAILKARHASQCADAPALADDSGLVVPALHGKPGIYSARFAGEKASDEENIECLLAALANIELEERHAQFYCAIAFMRYPTDPAPLLATGYCNGQIAWSLSGEQGFGYDPIFYVPEYRCTFANLPLEIKNTVSHRAKALLKIKQYLMENK